MNIEFKESVFRYIFPASLFWAPILISEFLKPIIFNKICIPDVGEAVLVLLFLIILIGTGILLSTIGGILILLFNWCYKPRWHKPETEINFWEDVGRKSTEFTQNKVDRRWNFYTTNLNSAIALFFSTLFLCYFYSISVCLIIVLLLLVIFFSYLACRGYKAMLAFDIKLEPMPESPKSKNCLAPQTTPDE